MVDSTAGTHVFFSYARDDEPRIRPIVEALRQEGLSVYWDRNLEFGANWLQEINAYLDAAPAIVVAWTARSIQSPFVQAEAIKAFERKALVPIMLENVQPPAPFGVVQSAKFLDGFDSKSDEWRNFISRIRELDRTSGARLSATNLADSVRTARAASQEKIAALIDPLRRIAASTDVAQAEVDKSLGLVMQRLSRDDLFTIAVVGRMKVGKSTLLNALLGPNDTVKIEPLPAEDLPCTATLIKLRFAERPYCRPFFWDRATNAIGAAMGDWEFKDFHERARIYVHGNETNIFDSIAEFEVGWPSPLLRAGVTLMDSPGISENPTRTELTRAALAEVDAAIVVYRSEPFAGTDEIEFAQEVTERAGKVFTLINLRGDHTMPASPALENVARSRLSLNPQLTLEAQEVYFTHLKDGLRASYKHDNDLAAHSGLSKFQTRLARFLISERYVAHLLKALREVTPMAKSLSVTVDNLIVGATADADKLRTTIAECRADVVKIERKKTSIDALMRTSSEAVQAAALRSFEAKIGQIAYKLPERLDRMSLGMDGFLDKINAGTWQNSKWVKKTAEKINAIVREELEAWATADSSAPGLAQDLKPSMDTLVNSLQAQAEEIGEIIQGMHTRIARLNPALQSDDKIVGDMEMAASVLSGALLFGPLGIVGLGGWRGVVGAVGGTVAAGVGVGLVVGLLHLAFPPTAIITAIGALGALGGALFGSTVGLEKRLKDKAWQAVEPKLRAMAHDEQARAQVRSAIDAWFDQLRAKVAEGISRIIFIEQQNLSRLDELARASEGKALLIERLKAYQLEVREAVKGAEMLEREITRQAEQARASKAS